MTHVFNTNFTVSSEFTFGDNLIPFWNCCFCGRTINSHAERTRRIQLFKSNMEQDEGIRLPNVAFAMDTQFTASGQLNGPGHLRRECLQVHDLRASPVLGTCTQGNQHVSGLSLCESGRLIQSVDVLVKAQSRRSCCAFGAPARICVSPCVVLSFLLHS